MKRISAEKEIRYISNVIEKNIEYYEIIKDKGFLSENILSQLRNLIEDVAILKEVQDLAMRIEQEDPKLEKEENKRLHNLVEEKFGDRISI